MAVAVADLADKVRFAVNIPGSTFVTTRGNDAHWESIVAQSFWYARLKRFFTDYRLSADETEIVTVEPAEGDMPGELQQIIVMMATLRVIESKMLELETKFRAKSGDDEFEVQRSAQVLAALLKAKRDELAEIREDLVTKPGIGTQVGIIDLALVKASCMDTTWIAA